MLKQAAGQRRTAVSQKGPWSQEGKLIWAIFCLLFSGESTYNTEFPTFMETAGVSTPSEPWHSSPSGQYGFLFHVDLQYDQWLVASG